jgi:hypothetical protein
VKAPTKKKAQRPSTRRHESLHREAFAAAFAADRVVHGGVVLSAWEIADMAVREYERLRAEKLR